MQNYLDLVRDVYENGTERQDRTGTGTRALFGKKLEYDLRQGFPMVTTKYTWFKGFAIELLWMLKGTPSAEFLLENNVHIWDEWLDHNNELGRVYGVQWREWRKLRGNQVVYVDQVAEVIRQITEDPHSRRIIVTAWNPGELDEMQLPPCHVFYQFYVDEEYLDIQVYQRSADLFLGVPFDIGLYSLLLSMVAQVTGKVPRHLHYIFGDTHIYNNHIEQVEELLTRVPEHKLPTLYINPEVTHINDFKFEDVKLINYIYQPAIKAPVSI